MLFTTAAALITSLTRALTEGCLRFVQALTHFLDPAGDVALSSIGLLIRSTAYQRLRVAHRIAQAIVSNGAGGLGHLA